MGTAHVIDAVDYVALQKVQYWEDCSFGFCYNTYNIWWWCYRIYGGGAFLEARKEDCLKRATSYESGSSSLHQLWDMLPEYRAVEYKYTKLREVVKVMLWTKSLQKVMSISRQVWNFHAKKREVLKFWIWRSQIAKLAICLAHFVNITQVGYHWKKH